MSALARFLDRDAVAKAILVATIGLAPSLAEARGGAPTPVPASAVVSEREILVALSGEAVNMRRVVAMLRDSTDRCLGGQARMLAAVEAASGPAAVRAATGERLQDIADEAEHDESGEEIEVIDRTSAIGAPSRSELARHAALREACLSWTERSVERISGMISEKGTSTMRERLTVAGAESARDLARITALEGVYEGRGIDGIEAMETNATRR